MKKPIHLLLGAGFALLVFSSYGSGPFASGAGNRTGSAGSTADCSTGGCHSANNSAFTLSIVMLDNGTPVTSYQVGKTYKVLLTGIAPGTGMPRFGFQISCVKASNTSQQAGTLNPGGRPNTVLRATSTPDLVEHSTPLLGTTVGSTTVDTVSFLWTPGSSQGTVRFYAIMNAVNFNGTISGDMPNAISADFTEATTGVAGLSQGLSGIYPNPVSSSLHVPLSPGSAEMSVLDALGRKVLGQTSGGQGVREEVMNVQSLPAGQYFLQVIQGANKQSVSFLKN